MCFTMLVNTSKQVYFNKARQILFKHNDLKSILNTLLTFEGHYKIKFNTIQI